MTSPRRTIEKLRRLAAGSGAEAESAQTILRALEEKHPEAVAELDAVLPAGEVFIACGDEYEQQVIARLASYLGCQAYRIKNRPGAHWRKGLQLNGPVPFLHVAECYAGQLLDKVRELLLATACGFSWGALPLDEPEQNSGKAKPMTADQRIAAAAAYELGLAHQPRAALADGASS